MVARYIFGSCLFLLSLEKVGVVKMVKGILLGPRFRCLQLTGPSVPRKNIFVRNSWLLSRKEKNSFVVRVDALGAR
jgi:hypothetical protein